MEPTKNTETKPQSPAVRNFFDYMARQEKMRNKARDYYSTRPAAAAKRLFEVAIQHTGGGRAASAVLLSLWNDHFVANLRDVISSLDVENTEATLALLATLGPGHHLERYLSDEHIARIIDVWGDMHEKRRAEA